VSVRPKQVLLRSASIAAALLVLTAVGSSSAAERAPAGAPPGETAQQDRPRPSAAFGYDLGEERHYRLGPLSALASGEAADWTIRLARFIESPDGWQVEFEFTHDRIERVPGGYNQSDLIGVNVYGSMRTNLDGFPLQIDFVQELSLSGETLSSSDVRRIGYRWDPDDRRFRKEVKLGKRDWDFDFGVARYDHYDEERPRGVYVYMPSALGCLGSSQFTCFENDPAFANPGFLSIVFPALMDAERGEREFLFLMPTTIGAPPFVQAMSGDWLSRERSSFDSVTRYFDRTRIRLGASEEIEIGPRTQHAWAMDIGAGIDKVWIEPEGRVLRVDLDTTRDNTDKRYIRYVFPFEAFVSPNDDPADECCKP
jgi:hypothetical protein